MQQGDELETKAGKVRLISVGHYCAFYSAWENGSDDQIHFSVYRTDNDKCVVKAEKYAGLPTFVIKTRVKDREFIARIVAHYAALLRAANFRIENKPEWL